MPILKAANNAETTLAQNIDSSTTSFLVADGSFFPDSMFVVTIDEEIMLVGTRNGNTFSDVTLGYENTTAASHSSGAKVENRFTAGTYELLRQYIDEGEDPDYTGVKYRLVMINGEPFMEVVDA